MTKPTRAARATRVSYGLLAAWLTLSGCGDEMTQAGEPTGPEMGPSGGEDDDSTPTTGTNGAKVVDAPPMHVAANDMRSRAPMDATPNADGQRVFYTALGTDAEGVLTPGVFATDAIGGGAIETLTLGAPLTAPVGISIDPDGDRLFIADSAWTEPESALIGAIVSLPASGGAPEALAATRGYVPRGLVIAEVSDETWLHFTGTDPDSGEAGAFRTSLEGGVVESVASGEPFADPAGIAVTSDGIAYVIDSSASSDGAGQASLLRVRAGEATRMVEGLGVGFPAGVAVTTDASTVLVSGLDPQTRRDRVFIVDAKTAAMSVIEKPFDDFAEPAGLHRAHDANTFAWADSEANGAGTVYVLEL